LVIILMFLGVVGCSTVNILPEQEEENMELESELSPQEPSQTTIPEMGGQLTIPLAMPDSFNPLFTASRDYINFAGLIYEGLFAYDENLNLVPSLVERWEVLEDGKKWHFYLKEEIKWHNGNELTAEDVKYTFDLLYHHNKELDEEEDASLYETRLFKDINIVGMELMENEPYTIVLILNEPAGRVLKDAFTFPILPKDIANSDVDSFIGTGPFKVDSGNMEIGGGVKLVRNEKWWKASKPYIDSILVKVYKDNVESMEAFKKGHVDLVDTHVVFVESPEIDREIQLYRYLTQSYNYIGINYNASSPLLDNRVRKAIAYAMDRKDIVSRVYSHNALAVDVPIPPDSWLYDPDLRMYDHQSEKAQQLLEEAGWTSLNFEGILQKNVGGENIPLSFTINANMDNNMHKEALNLIIEQLANVGVEVKPILLPWDEYVEALEQGDFEAVLGEYFLDLSSDLRPMLHSQGRDNNLNDKDLENIYIDNKDLNNFVGYKNIQLDGLLDKGNKTDDPGDIQETYKSIQEHLIEELPIISLYYKTSSLIVNERVQGIKIPRELMIFRDIEKWHLIE
ncbi:MAG TPA: ABC transporter substrate-binding protein, partial [Clostridia bacterium]|nr:ABC transporter substrate-binding protein [Clostridia bacterium]